MTVVANENRPVLGLIAFFFGVAALVAVTLLISGTFVEPDKTTGQAIGEIAADIRDSARRALSGEEAPAPAPEPRGWDINRLLTIIVPVLAGIAAVLGAISLFRQEARTLPAMAIGLGIGAFVMQYVFWLALLICGAILLVAIINNIGDILG